MDIFKVLIVAIIISLALVLTLWSMREYSRRDSRGNLIRDEEEPGEDQKPEGGKKLTAKGMETGQEKGEVIKGIIELSEKERMVKYLCQDILSGQPLSVKNRRPILREERSLVA
jgi:hypothetical protein